MRGMVLLACALAFGVGAAAAEGPTKPKPQPQKTSESGFSCGDKRYCKAMRSCAEARFHLEQCGERNLDRDGDGRPCENVCKR